MKIFSLFAGITLIAAGSVFAQSSQVIIEQRAREIRDQNNVRQGVTPPSQQTQPGQPAAAPTSANVSAVQQAQARLRADLSAIKANSQVTPEQKQRIASDIIAVAQGAKPSQQTAAVLAEDLANAYARKPLSDKDRDRFLSDLAAVLNPGNIQKPQMDAIYRDMQAIFQVNDDTRNDAVKIMNDSKSVGAQTAK